MKVTHGEITIDQRAAMSSLTFDIKVTGKRKMQFCIWIATILFRLGAAVLGAGVTVEVNLDRK